MVAKIEIVGPQKINGTVRISGAKNAALPLLAAGLLSDSGLLLKNVPPLVDVKTMLSLMEQLGVVFDVTKSGIDSCCISLKTDSINNFTASYDIVKKMRASILILGPMLSRFGRCAVSLPGGCAIGVRPIDLHLKSMEILGAEIELKDGYVHAVAPRGLKGGEVDFPIVTVTGTENVMMAAVFANGTTVLKNAAMEPEVVDLAICLNKMGADISGYGTKTIVINGVNGLHCAEHTVISDRIEAGTYAVAAGITGGSVDLIGGNLRGLLSSFIENVEKIGLVFTDIENGLRVEASGRLSSVNIQTEPYPGFPTDLQAQTMALLCLADGQSEIYESIWENRFMHVAELLRMGADIEIHNACAKIRGVHGLSGAQVMATDLRASFCLILAALAANGKTIIDRIYHLDRGYSCVEEKLARCGAIIKRIQ